MITRRFLCATAAVWPAAALAQNDPKFDAFLRGIRAEALKAGVDAGTLDLALAKVREIPRVMELARNQPEFKMTFDRYLELVVSDERVKNGRARLLHHLRDFLDLGQGGVERARVDARLQRLGADAAQEGVELGITALRQSRGRGESQGGTEKTSAYHDWPTF